MESELGKSLHLQGQVLMETVKDLDGSVIINAKVKLKSDFSER